jgi:hypothetical protein
MTTIQLYHTERSTNFSELARELSLVCYASDAADKMEFGNTEELTQAVQRAMEICLHAGLTIEANFKLIYKCSAEGIVYDWKLSVLGFHLVCLNGSSANPKTAHMQIDLVKSRVLHS